jgi:hypothetical protein
MNDIVELCDLIKEMYKLLFFIDKLSTKMLDNYYLLNKQRDTLLSGINNMNKLSVLCLTEDDKNNLNDYIINIANNIEGGVVISQELINQKIKEIAKKYEDIETILANKNKADGGQVN